MESDGGKDDTAPANRGGDALCPCPGIKPQDVACRIFGSDASGASCLQGREIPLRRQRLRHEQEAVIAARLPEIRFPSPKSIDAGGTEHCVRFRGSHVEKHQKQQGWVPVITARHQITIAPGLPSEYLRRLTLQNELFGDDIRIIGVTRGNRFATTQPTLKGGEPTEMEIRGVLEAAGWKRIPIELQDLPSELMGSAWWHNGEDAILVDARKPNFKKSDFGDILPIDLVIADLTPEMRRLLESHNTL